jgi:hypothetical protein
VTSAASDLHYGCSGSINVSRRWQERKKTFLSEKWKSAICWWRWRISFSAVLNNERVEKSCCVNQGRQEGLHWQASALDDG